MGFLHRRVTALAVVFSLAVGGLYACAATGPLELRLTAEQLQDRLKSEPPDCVRQACTVYSNGAIQCLSGVRARATERGMGEYIDPEKCILEYRAWQKRMSEYQVALVQRYIIDAASAPACVREVKLPAGFLKMLEIDAGDPDAVPQALARGAVVPSLDPLCMAQVCRWRNQVSPRENSPYCLPNRALAQSTEVRR